MQRYSIALTTISGVADSAFIDRLADIVYDVAELLEVGLFLESDGAVTASFDIDAEDPVSAVDNAALLFFDAFTAASPLRAPRPDEMDAAHKLAREKAEQLQVKDHRQFLADLSARLDTGRTEEAVPA